MKKKYSLKGKVCFKSVFLKGSLIKQKYCFFYVLKQCECKHSELCTKKETGKLGIVITRKFGNAVERNRAKRRLKMAFQEFISLKNYRVCIIAKPGFKFKNVGFDLIEKDFSVFSKRLGSFVKEE